MRTSLVLVIALPLLAACKPAPPPLAPPQAQAPAAPAAPAPVAAASGPVTVAASHVWCRAAPAAAMTGGCYMDLTAKGDDRLVFARTPGADRAEIHEMSVKAGVMSMREMPTGLQLPAGQAMSLFPGGLHLMIINPKAPMVVGGKLVLTLGFVHSGPLTVTAPILDKDPVPATDD